MEFQSSMPFQISFQQAIPSGPRGLRGGLGKGGLRRAALAQLAEGSGAQGAMAGRHWGSLYQELSLWDEADGQGGQDGWSKSSSVSKMPPKF